MNDKLKHGFVNTSTYSYCIIYITVWLVRNSYSIKVAEEYTHNIIFFFSQNDILVILNIPNNNIVILYVRFFERNNNNKIKYCYFFDFHLIDIIILYSIYVYRQISHYTIIGRYIQKSLAVYMITTGQGTRNVKRRDGWVCGVVALGLLLLVYKVNQFGQTILYQVYARARVISVASGPGAELCL